MSQLPIHKLTVYKQGIGYFERQGQVEDSRISLVVPRDGINDVLKSLTIAIRQGGRFWALITKPRKTSSRS